MKHLILPLPWKHAKNNKIAFKINKYICYEPRIIFPVYNSLTHLSSSFSNKSGRTPVAKSPLLS